MLGLCLLPWAAYLCHAGERGQICGDKYEVGYAESCLRYDKQHFRRFLEARPKTSGSNLLVAEVTAAMLR
jgi:hypothetical protein